MTKNDPALAAPPPPPISHQLRSRDLLNSAKPVPWQFTADAAQRQALADWFDLIELASFSVDGKFKANGKDRLRFEGRLQAHGAQRCGVTLAPVPFRLDQTLQRDWSRRNADTGEIVIDPEAEDDPDLLEDSIDIAGVALEELGLALPAWPRAPGAEFAPIAAAPNGATPIAEAEIKPFAALASLRAKLPPE